MIRRTEGDEVILVKAPYNAAFVNALKAEVDSDSRRWNPEEKVWVIDSAYEKLVRGLVDRHFGPQRSKPDPAVAASMAYYADPSPRGASGITTEKAYRAVQAQPAAPQPTIESLAAEVSRLTYELETERQRRASAEDQSKRIVGSAELLTGELRRERARVAVLDREVDRLSRALRSSKPSGSAPSPGLPDAYRVLGVTSDLPLEIVEVVYRRLAARHHPDVGGDPERMKRINVAYGQIRAAKQQRQQN